MAKVTIHTDGSCYPNPGPGGYAAIISWKKDELIVTGGLPRTTSSRMELMAAIAALEALHPKCTVMLYTDSQYLQRGMTIYLAGWKARGWLTSTGEPVKNLDLWTRLDALARIHNVEWIWVKGHAGHPINEKCDRLALEARLGVTP